MSTAIIKVLVIEDDVDILGLMVKVVKGMDFLPLEAQTISSGIQLAAQEKPDLVLLSSL